MKNPLDMLAQGFSRKEMLDDYGITDEHVRLALHSAEASAISQVP
jgi:uncharacterized protein (DUF433 family)